MALLNLEKAFLQTTKRRISQKIIGELSIHLNKYLGESIALAVSGGLDSRALLESIARWPQRSRSRILVLTVNHQTRPESGAECEAVHARALSLGFESEILTLFIGAKRDEATLRVARYDAIWRTLSARGIKILCTAHQKDDDAEGVFMDLFGFGGGKSGAGMKSVKTDGFGTVLRPFLGLERKQLLLFLTSIGSLDYFTDPSNANNTCARQKARDFLVQQAPHFHPNPIGRLAHIAKMRLEDLEMLEGIAENLDQNVSKMPNCVEIPIYPQMPSMLLRRRLKTSYQQLCSDRDPRDAAPIIAHIVKKAKGLGLIRASGVDPSANSITLCEPVRLNFDLPGAKALIIPGLVSLFRI